MKKYAEPRIREIQLKLSAFLMLSTHDEVGGDQLTRGRRRTENDTSDGGTSIWEEPKD